MDSKRRSSYVRRVLFRHGPAAPASSARGSGPRMRGGTRRSYGRPWVPQFYQLNSIPEDQRAASGTWQSVWTNSNESQSSTGATLATPDEASSPRSSSNLTLLTSIPGTANSSFITSEWPSEDASRRGVSPSVPAQRGLGAAAVLPLGNPAAGEGVRAPLAAVPDGGRPPF